MAVPKPPVTSLEAKLIQYHYVDAKLIKFQVMVNKLDPRLIPDLKPIMLMAGSIFNISDHFFRRSELLQKGAKFNMAQLIHLTGALTPLSWDSLEALDDTKSGIGSNWSTKVSFCELPTEKKSIEMVKLLTSLINNARMVLNEKIIMAREMYYDQNKQLFEFLTIEKSNQFDELDILSEFIHSDIPTTLNIKQQEQIKSFFRHSYFKMLKQICIFYQSKIDKLRLEHAKLTMKSSLNQMNYYQMYFNLLRIADLYVEIRKIGRWIYFDNASYFSQFARSNRKLKETVGEMSILFGSNKQNSIILSTISKYSKRTLTPINSPNLKYQMDQITSQFVIEARKAGRQMCETMIHCNTSLKNLSDEWDFIVKEDKEHIFSQDKLRAQMKQRVIESRNRQSFVVDPALATKAANMRAATNGASSASRQHMPKPPSRPQSNASSRTNSLTASGDLTKKLLEVKDTELGSTDEKRKMSLTSSSKSPFHKPPSRNQSRSNSLTNRSNSLTNRSNSLTNRSNSDLSKLFQKPKLTNDDIITPESSPLKSLSPSPIPSDGDAFHGLRRTSSARTSPTLQRRHSVISPIRQRPQVANGDTIRRRQSVYSPTDSNSSDSTSSSIPVAKTTATAVEHSTAKTKPPQLTAKQRLQQHIMKSQKNGSMLSKPMEIRKVAKPEPISQTLDTRDLGIDLNVEILSPPTETNFPGMTSPLNSLKKPSKNDAHAALTAAQRSRSNSSIINRSRAGSSSTNQLSRNASVRSGSHALRSRGGSTSSKSTLGGNTIVVEFNDKGIVGEDGEVIKKVRFTGISQYSEDEDAHTADRARKQMRQKWAAYKPLFRKLNSQEGETLRQFKEEERQHERPLAASYNTGGSAMFEALKSTPNEHGKVSMMNAINEQTTQNNSAKRISRLFGRR